MDFDPARPPGPPREAAAVILVRPADHTGAADAPEGDVEVLLVRRPAKAAFMAQAFVFPGGARDGEEDARVTAARELVEETGVLLAARPVPGAALAALRGRAAAGEPLAELLAGEGLALDLDAMLPFAHWVTPSAERRRFSARFFLAVLPAGQVATIDGQELVEARWVTPRDALAQAAELHLPPPQLRTVWELRAVTSVSQALELSRARAPHVRPLLPRFAPLPDAPGGFALLLAWDPDYEALGTGEAAPLPADHPLAGGPGRFVLDEGVWRQVGPSS